jgi:hypothetical protein
MSVWMDQRVEAKIRKILHDVNSKRPKHHFGPTWVTPYQLAIELEKIHPVVRRALGPHYAIGGRGAGREV